jgi:hypothetical protein
MAGTGLAVTLFMLRRAMKGDFFVEAGPIPGGTKAVADASTRPG